MCSVHPNDQSMRRFLEPLVSSASNMASGPSPTRYSSRAAQSPAALFSIWGVLGRSSLRFFSRFTIALQFI